MKKTSLASLLDPTKKHVEYRTISLTTVEGIKTAERLHQNGWKTNWTSPWNIQLYKTFE